jgi:phage virion morphogenesis protein
MSGLRIVIDDAEIMDALSQLQRAAQNPAKAMAEVAAALLQSTRRRFEAQTAPDGQKWQRLSPRTAAQRVGRKRKRGFDNILRRSNRLYKSITALADSTSATVGTNVLYASIHQQGGKIDIPAREQTLYMANRLRGNRFVKANSKLNSKRAKKVKIGAHSIIVPARPYLGINDADRQTILTTIADHFRREAGMDGGQL